VEGSLGDMYVLRDRFDRIPSPEMRTANRRGDVGAGSIFEINNKLWGLSVSVTDF
jgi:hypothetical protein